MCVHVSKYRTEPSPYTHVSYTSVKLVEKTSKQIRVTQATRNDAKRDLPSGGTGGGDPLHRAGTKPQGVASRGGQSWRSTLETGFLFLPFHILNDEKHFIKGRGGSQRASRAHYQHARGLREFVQIPQMW